MDRELEEWAGAQCQQTLARIAKMKGLRNQRCEMAAIQLVADGVLRLIGREDKNLATAKRLLKPNTQLALASLVDQLSGAVEAEATRLVEIIPEGERKLTSFEETYVQLVIALDRQFVAAHELCELRPRRKLSFWQVIAAVGVAGGAVALARYYYQKERQKTK